jgi:CheY-like chemotaxis protein
MSHTLTFASVPGRGSVFGVRLIRQPKARRRPRVEPPLPAPDPIGLRGLKVLCVDNDGTILDGMQALLGQWGIEVTKARSAAEAESLCGGHAPVDTVLADYHLGGEIDGIALLERLRDRSSRPFTAALLSADHGAELALAARVAGYPLLHKPLRPAALRALLSAFRRVRSAASAA